MHISRSATKRTPSSAPATPKIDRTDLGEYRLPFIMAQQQASKKARGRDELMITTAPRETVETSPLMSTATIPSSPVTPKQSPLSLMPPSPASGAVAMSPTRKESYKDLITRAISSHPDKLMTLSDIYAWIVANVEAYRDQSHIPSTQGWKNAIRHTLSFYKCFKRVKRHPSIEKPSYWTIDYSEQQTGPSSVAQSAFVPASPKASVTGASVATGLTANTIARPIPTIPTPVRPVPREEPPPEELPRTHDAATSAGDLRAWAANWPLRSDANASKEEQCIQGLLLFRTSAGFSFLPQSSNESRTTTTAGMTGPTSAVLPRLPASAWTAMGDRSSGVNDVLTYTSCAQVYSRHESGLDSIYQHAHGRYENGIQSAAGASVTVVVDTIAGSSRAPVTTTWTTASMRESERKEPLLQTQAQSPKQQRKPQLQKRYVDTPPASGLPQQQQLQQPPKPESVSYVQLIANAILATPEKRATLAQIYEWLVSNVAAFQGQGSSPSSVGWKNAVRHTLSTRPFFKRVICEEAFGRQKPAWWTVDVEAMTLASSLRQQQQNQMKLNKRRRNGHTNAQESVSAPLTGNSPPYSQTSESSGVSVIHRVNGDSSAVILEKAASEPPEPIRASMAITSEEIKWEGSGAIEKEVVSSPEATGDRASTVFRFPSSSVSSGATSSTISTCKSELISPVGDVQKYERTMDALSAADMVKNAVFESATGLDSDVFECLMKELTLYLDVSPSWSGGVMPRDALTFTLLRLRRQPVSMEQSQWPRRRTRKMYVRWLALLSSQLSSLVIWPDPDVICLLPTYLTDRLIAMERMQSPEKVIGVLDVVTLQVLFDHGDECCRRTINAVVVFNFEGAVVFRSKKTYWLGCMHHASTFQSGLRSIIEDCFERELKEKLATKSNGGRMLLTYRNINDVLPRPIYVVRSKTVRNLLREKFGDRFSRFDALAKPIMLKRKGSSAVTVLSTLDDAVTVCSGLLNLSAPIAWDDDNV